MNCKMCEIETDRPMFCSRSCSQKYRRKFVYGDKFTNKYRAASPRNFLQGLAKKKADIRNLTVEYLFDMYQKQNGLCALSGKEMTYITGSGRVPTNISIDRIDSNIGYDEGNIQLVCVQANKMKQELTGSELTDWCECISNHLKGKK